jgi:hypothetical protein
MATKKTKKKSGIKAIGPKRARGAERIDRRFSPMATTSPRLLYALIVAGALCIGLGVYAHFFREQYSKVDPAPWAFWPMAVGGFLVAAAVWFSTNGDAALRVGDPGVAEERSGVRRIPWHSLESVTYDESRSCLVVTGKDEADAPFSFKISVRAHRDAAARLLEEANERVPGVVDVPAAVALDIGAADPNAGLRIKEPLQLVGKRCVISGKVIAYELDARVCPQCDRVYHKRHVPKECACGASLTGLQDGMLPKDFEALGETPPNAAPASPVTEPAEESA